MKPGSTLKGWERNAFRVARAVLEGDQAEAQRQARDVMSKLADKAQRTAEERQREIDRLARGGGAPD